MKTVNKKTFDLDKNTAYPKHRGVINIIGSAPKDKPYLSVSFYDESGEVAHSWVKDKDLKILAVNILKSLGHKSLTPTIQQHGK